jgi:phosphoadenosine phosphosulfate reductase
MSPTLAVPATTEPRELLGWAVDTFADRFAIVTALQVEGIVLVDMARRVHPKVRVVTIDTGRLPQQTHDFVDTVRARLDVTVEVVAPDPELVGAMTTRHGANLFRRDVALRRLCCHARKVEPMDRVLAGVDAWATGLRRDGAPSRAGTPLVERVTAHGEPKLKLSPLAAWTRADVLAYAEAERLPMHPLYADGYTSIGCAPCTRPVAAGEDERAGRWWWEAGANRECGLHHASPSERFDRVLGELRADVAAAAPVRTPRGKETG